MAFFIPPAWNNGLPWRDIAGIHAGRYIIFNKVKQEPIIAIVSEAN